MSRSRWSLVAVAGALLLAGCGATPPAEPTASGAASETASGADATEPAASEPATDEPSATPPPEPAASCLAIDITADTVDGTTLGTCLSEALHVIGTFKASSDIGDEHQEAEIQLRPDLALHGTSPDSEVIFVDDVAYENEGDGWVQGDLDSEDSEEYIVAAAGLLFVSLFAGDILKESIAACPVWDIEVGSIKLTLPDGEVVDTRVFSCAAPFDTYGMTTDPMHVWIGADWTPYGYESTVTGLGQVIDGVSYYYDHGEPVDISAPI